MKNLICLCIVLFVMSCSHLTPRGRLIQVWDEVKPEQNANYREVGEVTCKSTIFMVTRNFNRKRCIEGLRNATSKLKGDVVVVDKEKAIPGFMSTGVDLSATAYKNIR